MEPALLDTIVYTFLQDTNTNGTTGKGNEDEKLTITYESCQGGLNTDPGFYVIRTDGWSMDEPEDLLGLFEQIKNIKFEK
jgi:hypothetical protein